MRLWVTLVVFACVVGTSPAEEKTQQTPSEVLVEEQDQPYSARLTEALTELEELFGPSVPDPKGREYFPKGQGAPMGGRCTEVLNLLKEPSLSAELPKDLECALRFIYFPSLDEGVVIVRLEISKNEVRGRTATFKLDIEKREILVLDDKEFNRTREQTADLEKLVAANTFWKRLSEKEMFRNLGTFDGASWIFEMRDHTSYQMIDVTSPSPDPNQHPDQRDWSVYNSAGRLMWKLAGFPANK